MRKTHALIEVAQALLADPNAKHWGYALVQQTRMRSGVLYPLLWRLLKEGLLSESWEEPNDRSRERPLRRYYELTPIGLERLRTVLQEAQQDPRFATMLAPWPASMASS